MTTPPIKHTYGLPGRKKLIRLGISLIIALIAPTAALQSPQKAAAYTGQPPNCPTNYLHMWDWPKMIRDNSQWPEFNPESSKYVIGLVGTPGTPQMTWQLITAGDKGQGELIAEKNTSGVYQIRPSVWTIGWRTLHDNPEKVHGTQYANPYVTTGWNSSSSNTPLTNLGCVIAAKGVVYAQSYDLQQFETNVRYGTGDGTQKCDALAIGCWMGKLWNGVADTFSSVGQAILKGIAWLFAPESQDLNYVYTDFKDYMDWKLGMLIFPFSYVIDLFNAYTSSANAWCTPTSCEKDLGNVMGGNMKFDFLKWRDTAPTMYNFFLALTRGITVVALVGMMYKKYMEVAKG